MSYLVDRAEQTAKDLVNERLVVEAQVVRELITENKRLRDALKDISVLWNTEDITYAKSIASKALT